MRKAVAAILLALTACTGAEPAPPVARPNETASPSPSPSPGTPSPSPAVRATFSAARALAHVRTLVRIGAREAASAGYRRAADAVAVELRGLGYRVRLQRFAVPAGTVSGTPVRAGTSSNVVAEPPGFDPARRHVVVGGHLDTVPGTVGANDNASGVGVLLELARVATIRAPRLPVVFVAFGAEERRRQSRTQSRYALGSQAYIDSMSRARARALEGMLNIDMVGNGDNVVIVGRSGPMVPQAIEAARRLDIPFEPRARITNGFSDHVRFEEAGYPIAWLWAGDHPTLHRPSDTFSVVQRAEIGRIGRVAWEMLRRLDV